MKCAYENAKLIAVIVYVGLNEVDGDFYGWWTGRTTQRPKIQRSSQRSDCAGSRYPRGPPQVSFAPAQRAARASTPERGLLAETEGRPALTDASGKKRRKLN